MEKVDEDEEQLAKVERELALSKIDSEKVAAQLSKKESECQSLRDDLQSLTSELEQQKDTIDQERRSKTKAESAARFAFFPSPGGQHIYSLSSVDSLSSPPHPTPPHPRRLELELTELRELYESETKKRESAEKVKTKQTRELKDLKKKLFDESSAKTDTEQNVEGLKASLKETETKYYQLKDEARGLATQVEHLLAANAELTASVEENRYSDFGSLFVCR